MKGLVATAGQFLLKTKLFWGLAVLYGAGVILSPVNRKGANIFLEPSNQADVLRQVSNNGMIAVGMTLVILTGGIDLSVGSMMALGCMLCAMLLTLQGWTAASLASIPILGVAAVFLCSYVVPLIATNLPRGSAKPVERAGRTPRLFGVALGLVVAGLLVWWTTSQLQNKFGVLGVLITVPAVGLVIGALTGLIIAKGKLQPFIVTLAMMVAVLGVARLLGGETAAVYPVYTGSNATEQFDILRALVLQVVPVPGIFFLVAVLTFGFILKYTAFGRYIYAIGGNEQAARLAGIHVDQIKVAVYAISGMLATLAGVLYTAQYRQGKPDAGTGAELDAIAAVVIGGTNLMGGKGSMTGTFVGVLIFGFLTNILLLKNINSNIQFVLKGAIILAAVLLQEGQIGLWWKRLRARTKKVVPGEPRKNEVL
ncbi:MAG TPA: ABC transporter permease, partial [Chthoniobacterales bacterium]|nr:ABC transporter permease [Chthoniobacterales bacterium]